MHIVVLIVFFASAFLWGHSSSLMNKFGEVITHCQLLGTKLQTQQIENPFMKLSNWINCKLGRFSQQDIGGKGGGGLWSMSVQTLLTDD